MKILIVNTYDRGGAANACLRLHDGLLKKGIDSKVLLKSKQKDLLQTFQYKKARPSRNGFQLIIQKIISFLRVSGILKPSKSSKETQFVNERAAGLDLFSFPNSKYDITTSPLYEEADIINLHWVGSFLDYESFFRKNTKPVVWTLHDMNPFTGGEHYLETNMGLDTAGESIQRVLSEKEKHFANKNLILKQKVLQNIPITVVAPSSWLCQEAQKSVVFRDKDVHCIPYGIDSEVFQPRDQQYSRSILNIPRDKTVILFVADLLDNHRKGYAILTKALQLMKRDDVVLCAVGRKTNGVNVSKNTIELGSITDERFMSMVYSAADFFVIPSIMDNLPNTVLESLMCGTPVIGFPIGGIPDMIEDGENGLLARDVSSQSLSVAMEHFISSKETFNRQKIREQAKIKYSSFIQAEAYINLFSNILEQQGN